MGKVCFIFNPCSGRNRRRPWLPATIREFITAHALDARFLPTSGPGHATLLARDAVERDCTRVIAIGGDGTMNEVAQALIGTPVALGLVPCGSGNGLALHLGIPTGLSQALALVAGGGRVASLDTGTVNGRPFFNAMGLGLDAQVSARFNGLARRGLPAYARIAYRVLREVRSERVVITTESRREEHDILLLAVANSDQYGNNARIAPGARVDDGTLDLVAIGRVGLGAAALLVARLFAGTIDRSPRIRRWRGDHFVIDRVAPGLIHTDGETHPAGSRLEVAVRRRSLRLLVPLASTVSSPWTDPAPAGFALQLP